MNTEQLQTSLDTGNQVSRASVFGVFLTLTLCLLAQPYGSFLYSQPESQTGSLAFSLWRLNPLACTAESVAILYVFLRSWFHNPTVTKELEEPRLQVRKDVRLKAAALLLLRADKRSNGRRIVNQLQPYSKCGHQERAKLREEAFSTNAFTVRELWVTIATYVAMLTVIIKLAVSTLPWHISIWAWLLVSGWLVLQSLLVAEQSAETMEDDFDRTIQWMDLAGEHLHYPILEVILSAVSLPAFGYMAHVLCTQGETVPLFVRWIEIFPILLQMPIFAFIFPVTATLLLSAFLVAWDELASRLRWGRFSLNFNEFGVVLLFVITMWMQLGFCYFWIGSCLDWTDKLGTQLSPPLFVVMMYALLVWPIFFETRYEGEFLNSERPLIVLILNLSVTVVVFSAVMTCYDPAGTSRPSWADWLG